METLVNQINAVVWSDALVYLCLGTGLFFSVLTRFVQVRLFREMIRLLFSSRGSDRGISSFQALSVSLSGRVGTGNIAGVAAAIGFGGPSAVFWMWVVAFLGAATAYVESALGQIYKEEDEGQLRGGPAFYIEKAMGQKWYAWIFAIATIIATGLLLPGVQANSIGNAAEVALGAGQIHETVFGSISGTKLATAVAVVAGLGFIIFGGVKRIAHFTQIVVPFMALAYMVTAVVIIVINISQLPAVIGLIFKDIFTPMAYYQFDRGELQKRFPVRHPKDPLALADVVPTGPGQEGEDSYYTVGTVGPDTHWSPLWLAQVVPRRWLYVRRTSGCLKRPFFAPLVTRSVKKRRILLHRDATPGRSGHLRIGASTSHDWE